MVKPQTKGKDAETEPAANGTTTTATNGSEPSTNGAETTTSAETTTNGSVDLNGVSEVVVEVSDQG
ncbi:MAG TPA: hypothetical protein P5526_03850 [Anaerolineae bacterium]|nr:hypothetical protein [Anaerolineae bacterium]